MQALDIHGARSRNRTGTPLRAGDFKSHASTSFAIRAVARCCTVLTTIHNPDRTAHWQQRGKYIHHFPVKQVCSCRFKDKIFHCNANKKAP